MMKSLLLSIAAILLLMCGTTQAQEVVLNNGFEMQGPSFYAYTGNIQSWDRGVDQRDTVTPGVYSWAYWQIPSDSGNGGYQQWIYVIAGVTYEINADVCYHNC